jgi:acetyl-CoA acyltransferase
MSRQLQEAYIVAATRTAVGKAPRGVLRTTRPDSMLAHALRSVVAQLPSLPAERIEDVIVGCAIPEYEQGMNVARIGLLLAGLPAGVAGMTVNRFCASGLNAVSIAADRIRTGEADVMIAAGTESMSMIPMLARMAINADVFTRDENLGIAYGMGLTAERSLRDGRSRARTRTPLRWRRIARRSRRRRAANSRARSRRSTSRNGGRISRPIAS